MSTAAGRETTARSSGHVLADGQRQAAATAPLPDAAAWRAHSDAGREHDIRCRCGPCNPEECGVKHPTRSYYCMEDKGHDGPHVDHEDRFIWSRTLGAPQHSFYWRTEPGRNSGGKRVVSACCPCGWTHMTAYPLLRRASSVRYLRYRWMDHVSVEQVGEWVRQHDCPSGRDAYSLTICTQDDSCRVPSHWQDDKYSGPHRDPAALAAMAASAREAP